MACFFRYIGKDAHGTPRVYGTGFDSDTALSECVQAATEYVRMRPDTGPLSRWSCDPDPANYQSAA